MIKYLLSEVEKMFPPSTGGRRNKTKGMALVIVLALATILLLGAIANYKTGHLHRGLLKNSTLNLQAEFMALAALQHAQLKVRFFPTEMYDASQYSLGKNPYFDFSTISNASYSSLHPLRKTEYISLDSSTYIHVASSSNPGPRFISQGTISTDPSTKWFQMASLDPDDSDPTKSQFLTNSSKWFPSGWPTNENGEKILNSDLYLWKFRSDITNSTAIQPTLSCQITNAPAPLQYDISTPNSIPYIASYQIVDLQVLTMVGQQRMNQEAVKIVAKATVFDPIEKDQIGNHISVTLTANTVIKVSRR
ncbi:MAG: hypothetical protein HQM08_11150 [Candidatus Riflebacteria bacterium]|nr:hypothetical protein [Candidatus Riflebacteria bacterium]